MPSCVNVAAGAIRCYDLPVLRDRSPDPTPVVERETSGSYTREEVCRLLKIDSRQLRTWERQELIPELTEYRFADLLTVKAVCRLREEKAHPKQIRAALRELNHILGSLPHLSRDVRVYKEGRRVRIQIGKQRMESVSGQFLLDFAADELNKLLQLPASQKSVSLAEKVRHKLEADRWFERGLELEATGAPYEQIIEAYQKASELDPNSAGARVNLGTVFFNGHAWSDAEAQYKEALRIDPNYALAHFNLGNLYDEEGDPEAALYHYEEAIRLYPAYADAHYNLALLRQSLHDVMRAVRHWRAYLKLDGASEWAEIARRELRKLEAVTVVNGSRPKTS